MTVAARLCAAAATATAGGTSCGARHLHQLSGRPKASLERQPKHRQAMAYQHLRVAVAGGVAAVHQRYCSITHTHVRLHGRLAAAHFTPAAIGRAEASDDGGVGVVSGGASVIFAEYQRQREDYAGAGACIPDDPSLPPGHIMLVDGMALIFRSFWGMKNRDPLLNSAGEDVSVMHAAGRPESGKLISSKPSLAWRRGQRTEP